MDARKELELIAREKCDKLSFWMCAGIIGICHSLIMTKFVWFLFIPIVFAIVTLICNYLSSFIYYIVSENSDKTDIPNKTTNILHIIFSIITLISFIIIYLIYIIDYANN